MYMLKDGIVNIRRVPEHLDIEVTSRCNYKCPKCWHSFMNIESEDIDPMLFMKVIDEGVGKGLKTVKFNFRGEPLLYNGLEELIQYANDRGLHTSLNTNGYLLSKEKVKSLFASEINEIRVSIDACEREGYKKSHGKDAFMKVLSNMIYLSRFKGGKTKIEVIVTKNEWNEGYIKSGAFEHYWINFCDEVWVTDYFDLQGSVDLEPSDFVCNQLFTRLVVLANGTVLACCGMWNVDKIVGNAWHETIEDLWRSEKLVKYRKMMLHCQSHKIPMCITCNLREVYRNGK